MIYDYHVVLGALGAGLGLLGYATIRAAGTEAARRQRMLLFGAAAAVLILLLLRRPKHGSKSGVGKPTRSPAAPESRA